MSDTTIRVNVPNVDNEYLGAWGGSGFVVGHVDNVNGAGAAEVPAFTSTVDELVQLLKYWARTELEIDYEFFITDTAGGAECRLRAFAGRRAARISDLLPETLVRETVDEVTAAFGQRQVRRYWDVFLHGSPMEQNRVLEELWGSLSNADERDNFVVVLLPAGEEDIMARVERLLEPYNGNPDYRKIKSRCCESCREWLRTKWRGPRFHAWYIGGQWDGSIKGNRREYDGLFRPVDEALPDNVTTAAAFRADLASDKAKTPDALVTPDGEWLRYERGDSVSENETDAEATIEADRNHWQKWRDYLLSILDQNPDATVVGIDCGSAGGHR